MTKIVFMCEVFADTKDGGDYEASLDIACKSNLGAAKRHALKRVTKVQGFATIKQVRCTNVYSFDGENFKMYQARFSHTYDADIGVWHDITDCISSGDKSRIKALSASRGLGPL